MGASPTAVFECTGCGRCCRSLVDSTARGLPAGWEALAREGYYPLPREGGLQVWSWERRRMLAAADRATRPPTFRPALAAVADLDGRAEAVVLLWELDGAACPLVTDDNRCSIYEGRPVVCRAYPLLVRGGEVTVSSLCPGAVMPPAPSALRLAYGPSATAALAAARVPPLVARHLAFLETSGRLALRRGLAPAEAQALVEAGAAVDVLDLLEREGVTTQAALEEKCAAFGVAYG